MKRNETDWTVAPGETLDDLLEERGMSRRAGARACEWPTMSFNQVCRGKARVTAALAVRLERAFGTPAQFWVTHQANHDLHVERQKHEDTCYRSDDEDNVLGPVCPDE